MAWNPSDEARAVGESLQGRIPNVQGSQLTTDDVSQIQLAVKPAVRALASYIRSRWGLSSAGTARGASIRKPPRRADGSLRRRDVHEEGRAIDAMIGRDLAKGREIAEWCVINAARLGIQYLIWDRTEWSSSTFGAAFEPYTGTSPHTDHVHLEVTPAMANDAEAMRQAIFEITGSMPPAVGSEGSPTPRPSPAPRPSAPPAAPTPAQAQAPSSGTSSDAAVVAGGVLAFAGAMWWAARRGR